MTNEELRYQTALIKVMDRSFDLRVQFIQNIKQLIRDNNIPDEYAEDILRAVAGMNENQIVGLSAYAEAFDFDFPGVSSEEK